MKKSADTLEKRKHERFQAAENLFAIIKKRNKILCKVVNISKGGLLFYSEDLAKIKNDTLKVDIYIDDNQYLKDVPAKIVSDFTLQDKKYFDGFPIRYLRLSFDELTNEQKSKLINILKTSNSEV
jgi:hypothetical protein